MTTPPLPPPAATSAAPKQRGRPFQKGASGNPRGRAPGTRNRATRIAQELLDGEAEQITRRAIDLAKCGDPVALRLCLERIIPARRELPVDVALPAIASAGDLPAAYARLLEAAAGGELVPGEAEKLAGLLAGFLRAHEATDLERRLADLERLALASQTGKGRR